MTSNLYKVGDWVYCEISPFQPYVIRKIEELTKTPNGNVEAKVLCAFRLHDIPTNVLQSVERYQPKAVTAATTDTKTETRTDGTNNTASESTTVAIPSTTTTTTTTSTATVIYFEEHEVADLNEQQRFNLKHREVFYSKYTDTIAATSIRAKCSVLLFNEEVEKYSEYLGKDDSFFYHLTYDPYQKSLVNDKGEIRVGFRFQTEIPPLRPNTNGVSVTIGMTDEQLALEQIEKKEANDRVTRSRASLPASALLPEIPILAQTEELMQWCPLGLSLQGFTNRLDDDEIEKFILLTKSVGTFARALDTATSLKQPSLHVSASSASRDITIQHAMNLLHESNYDIGKAALSLVVGDGPVLCRDEQEEWSVAEANLFEDALDKYGKDFNEIRKDYLPWKSIKSIIEYYYMWKTTDRYLQRKNTKVAEQESKLKQVYIPNASKQNQSALIKTAHVHLFQQYDVHLKNSCESCGAPSQSTNQWYAYNPTNLVQQIMNGSSNPQALAAAQAQAIANIIANQSNPNNANPNVSIYQARLCADCWVYYKKFSLFKYANARQERLNQLKNQVHKCSVNGCGKEFKAKQLLIKHCGIAHGYFAKAATNPQNPNSERPQAIRNRTAFYLLTTPMTRASRLVCTNTVKLKRLAKKPFKLVDLSELNKEWTKESNRNITELLEKRQKRVDVMLSTCQARRKLHVKLIDSVAKNRSKLLKSNGKEHHNGSSTNGHNGHAADAEDSNDLVIDQVTDEDHQNDQPKPEYFKYFEQKCTTPCYTPDRFAFPKPSADQINKYFVNLMSQNRKRTLEQANNEKLANGNTNNANSNGQSNDSDGPVNKRSLLNNNESKPINKETGQQLPMRLALKTSNKPVQSINLPVSKLDEELCYIAVSPIKEVRNQIKMSVLRQLARSPTKSMSGNNQNLYSTVEKAVDSWRQTHPSKVNGHNSNGNNDSESGENHHHQNGNESSNGKIVKSNEQKEVNAVTGGSMVMLD